MTKKKQKPHTTSTNSVTSGSTDLVSPVHKVEPEFDLIRFDKKAIIFISACILLFFLFVGLKWHNASIANWNQFVNDGGDPQRGLILGEPRPIRSDEWQINSSFILAQHAKNFPVSNEALGSGKTPLAFGMPTQHILSKTKPALWGYYFLDLERAFAWHWNFKIFPFLISMFLLFMLFTKNNFLLSVLGSIWLLLSSAIQWWSINTELFAFGSFAVIGFIYILFEKKPLIIVASGVLFFFSAYSFVMLLYPAYQVPFGYFLLALILGFTIKNRGILITTIKMSMPLRILTLGASLALIFSLIYLFFIEARDTIEVVTNTVYPGKRNEPGGDFSFLKMYTDNFSLFMNQDKFPPQWLNISELSSYLMLFPVASIIILTDFFKTKKIDALLMVMLIFQAVMFIWFFIGFPEFLAKLTLFNSSPPFRTFFVFGFANVVATVLFLAHHKPTIISKNIVLKVLTFLLVFSLGYGIHYFLNQQTEFYFSHIQILIATVIFAVLNWLVLYYHHHRIYPVVFAAIILLFVMPNLTVNPLSKGLSPYFENEIFKTVSTIQRNEPDAGWAVFGQYTTPNFLKATGVNCFNGVQFVPPLEKLHVLDPHLRSVDVYNRYAHIAFASAIDGQDSIRFVLQQSDLYTIEMDPCSPKLYQLGIKYVLFTYPPYPIELQCLTMVKEFQEHFIYKRKGL